jgi:tetratricopeptide (TPR) repeat protein
MASAWVLMEKISVANAEELAFVKENADVLNTPEAYLNLSLKYYNLGKYQNCIDASNSALKLRFDYAAAFNNICAAHNALGNFDRAIEACESALTIDPDNKLARGNLNWAKSQQEAK